MRGADAAKEGDAFVAARRAGSEVHVLQDDADVAARDGAHRGLGVPHDDRLDVVDVEENPQRARHRGLVFDDQDLRHRARQTLRVAVDGGTMVARNAGGMVDSKPLIHSSSIPAATSCHGSFTSDTRLSRKRFRP